MSARKVKKKKTVATDISWTHNYSNVLSVEHNFQMILLSMRQHKPTCLGNCAFLITSRPEQNIFANVADQLIKLTFLVMIIIKSLFNHYETQVF